MANGSSGGAPAPKVVRAEEHQLTGHEGSVLCARVFRGRLLFSGSVDGTLKVWVATVLDDVCHCTALQQMGKDTMQMMCLHRTNCIIVKKFQR